MAQLRDIDISKDLVEKYTTNEVLRFVVKGLKKYNRDTEGNYNFDLELQHYIDILDALEEKLNGKEIVSVL